MVRAASETKIFVRPSRSSRAMRRFFPAMTRGWTRALRKRRASGSENTIRPRPDRSMVRSAFRMSGPTRATIFLQAGRPGAMTWWAASSADWTKQPFSRRRLATTDLPQAIPPVRATRSTLSFLDGRGDLEFVAEPDGHALLPGSGVRLLEADGDAADHEPHLLAVV